MSNLSHEPRVTESPGQKRHKTSFPAAAGERAAQPVCLHQQ